MRKFWLMMAVVCVVTVGCHWNKPVRHGVVCRITVRSQQGDRAYTNQEKMSRILNGLRQLGSKTLATADAKVTTDHLYQIVVESTDGTSTVYNMAGEQLLQKNQEPWKQTEPMALTELLLVLENLPPDE